MQVIYCGEIASDTYSKMAHNNKHICLLTGGACHQRTFEFIIDPNDNSCKEVLEHNYYIDNIVDTPSNSIFILNNIAYLDTSFVFNNKIDDDEDSSIYHCFITWDIPFYSSIFLLTKQLSIRDITDYIFWIYFQLITNRCKKSNLKNPRKLKTFPFKSIIIIPHIQSLKISRKLNRNLIQI